MHIYNNHQEQVLEQLGRKPTELPTMKLNSQVTDLFKFEYDDFELLNYQAMPSIRAPIAV